MKKVYIKSNEEKKPELENKELAEAIVCFQDICKNSELVFKALVLKAGKENDFDEKIDENEVLTGAVEVMEHFVKCIKPMLGN